MQGATEVSVCRRQSSGFTLIELVVVMAIISILATVALQAYNDQAGRAANGACLSEAKAYANLAAMAFFTPDMAIPTPVVSACDSIETATNLETPVSAVAKSPGNATIVCDMSGVAVCSIIP